MGIRVRHTTPSIFNLSMVDVVFCTLGCVILLWLWKMEQETEQKQQLAKKETENQALTTDLDKKAGLLEGLTGKLAQRDKELNELRKELERNGLSIEDLRKALTTTKDERDKIRKERDDLDRQVAMLEKLKQQLEDDIKQAKNELGIKDKDYKTSQQRAEDLDKKLKQLELLLAKVETQAAKVTGLETDIKNTKEQLSNEKTKAKDLNELITKRVQELTELTNKLERLEKVLKATEGDAKKTSEQLTSASKKSIDLQKLLDDKLKDLEAMQKRLELIAGEKTRWELKAGQWEALSKNRFAGVDLTGKRVVFLLDMSGSMELLSETQPAPNKWADVQRTLVNIMKSMPNLEKYQLIGFSEKPRYLLGEDGKWLTFDPKTSPDEVAKMLAEEKNKPKGGTNMYAAMEIAFLLRAQGLDTIYLLSDGLPNIGEGITENENRTLPENQKSEKLGRHVRKVINERWNLADENKTRVRINSVGFYYESPDLGAFLWALSRENDGNFVGMSKP